MAKSDDLDSYGLVGKAVQAVFMIDTTMATTENLQEYLQAKMIGEGKGDCEGTYPECPVGIENLDNIMDALRPEMLKHLFETKL
jgi:hypothetical protein